jgi:hypothetical protein
VSSGRSEGESITIESTQSGTSFAVREQKLVEQPREAEEQEDLREREALDPVDVELISDTVPEAPSRGHRRRKS